MSYVERNTGSGPGDTFSHNPANGSSLTKDVSDVGTVADTAPSGNAGKRASGEQTEHPLLEGLETTPANELRHRLWDAVSDLEDRDARITQMQATIRELAQRLSGVAQFIDMREDIEERLELMQRTHQEQIEKYKAEAETARLEMLENRVRLRALEEEVRRNHDRDVDQRASELLDERTREVNAENVLLMKDKVLLSKDVEAARTKATALTQDNATLRQHCELAASTEAELLARSVQQKKEIAALKAQIRSSEDTFTRAVEEYEARIRRERTEHQKEVAGLVRERDEARSDAKRLQSELVKLRAASTRLVQQRGDMEQFFFEALSDVRARVLEEKRQRLLLGAPATNHTFRASQTTSSTLRLDSQKQRLQLTEGKSTLPSSSFHNAATATERRRLWGTDNRGLPVLLDASKVSGKALPPIPGNERATASAHLKGHAAATSSHPPLRANAGLYSDRQSFHTEQGTGYEDADDVTFYENDGLGMLGASSGLSGLATIPDAPTWKEIQSVDIKDLSWADKERVIRLLFKRLRQQQRYLATKRVHEQAMSTTEQEPGPSPVSSLNDRRALLSADDDVFLTQQ